MKKILLYLGYGTWGLSCFAIIAGIGKAVIHLFEKDLFSMIMYAALGSVMILILVILGLLTLSLIDMMFGNSESKACKLVEDMFP